MQCLLDYDIPLILGHTVTRIHGRERLEGVTISQVDGRFAPVAGTERFIPCDTLLLSVGLIPENELSKKAGILIDLATGGPVVDETFETSVPGIYACGNVVHVHDLVDDVTEEGYIAGRYAALRAVGKLPRRRESEVFIERGRNVRYVVPQKIRWETDTASLALRVNSPEQRVRLCLASQGGPLLQVPQARVRPGEMVRLVLSRPTLGGAQGQLTVSVEKEGMG